MEYYICLAITFIILGVLSYYDLRYLRLPDWLTLPGAVLGFTLLGPGQGVERMDSILGALVGSGSLGLLWLVGKIRKKPTIGLGDVKLMLMVGAVSGISGLPMVLLVAGTGACCQLKILEHKHSGRYYHLISFGIFLLFGFAVGNII